MEMENKKKEIDELCGWVLETVKAKFKIILNLKQCEHTQSPINRESI